MGLTFHKPLIPIFSTTDTREHEPRGDLDRGWVGDDESVSEKAQETLMLRGNKHR